MGMLVSSSRTLNKKKSNSILPCGEIRFCKSSFKGIERPLNAKRSEHAWILASYSIWAVLRFSKKSTLMLQEPSRRFELLLFGWSKMFGYHPEQWMAGRQALSSACGGCVGPTSCQGQLFYGPVKEPVHWTFFRWERGSAVECPAIWNWTFIHEVSSCRVKSRMSRCVGVEVWCGTEGVGW